MEFEFKKQIARLFGLGAFTAGLHLFDNSDSSEDVEIEFEVDVLWAAKVDYFARPIVVAVMHTETECKGVLVDIAEKMKKHSLVVDLIDWDDPVQRALRTMNLVPAVAMPAFMPTLRLAVSTPLLHSDMFMEMDDRDPSLGQLSKAVLKTVDKIARLYGGRDWQELFQTHRDDE